MPDLGTWEIALLALLAALALGPAGGVALLRDVIGRGARDEADARLPAAMAPAPRFCTECGASLRPHARACAACGTRVRA